MAEFRLDFINDVTRQYFEDPSRNLCLSGGYGSGKTTVALKKRILFALAFRNYKTVIGRKIFKELKATTLETFRKNCPDDIIARWDMVDGIIEFKNGSQFLCMHLDTFDEQALKGLEVNSIYLDQPEELDELIFTVLDTRVDRWDMAEPDEYFVKKFGIKPQRNAFGKWIVPHSYDLTPNPDVETHWIYRYFHPDSSERRPGYAYYEVSSVDNPALSKHTLNAMLSKDKSWVDRFVHGKWGISDANIHRVSNFSRIKPPKEVLQKWIKKSILFRTLDHGETSPTCCLWWLCFDNYYVCYREYYVPGRLVSHHRQQINDRSEGETYTGNWADPQIFKTTNQKYGGFWSISNEYADPSLSSPPLIWTPADNAELSTRNRINELLAVQTDVPHILTGECPAPQIYFVERDQQEYGDLYGCSQVISQTNAQKREKLDEINGRAVYSDERDKAIIDHAYDPLRYFVAMHARGGKGEKKAYSPSSFLAARRRLKALRIYQGQSRMGR